MVLKLPFIKLFLNIILDRVLEVNNKANELKYQFGIAKSQLGFEFVKVFK